MDPICSPWSSPPREYEQSLRTSPREPTPTLNPQYFSLVQSLPTPCARQPPMHSEEMGSNLSSPSPDPGSALILPVMKCRHGEDSQHACRSCPETRRAVSQMSKRCPRSVRGNVCVSTERPCILDDSGGSFFFQKKKKKSQMTYSSQGPNASILTIDRIRSHHMKRKELC